MLSTPISLGYQNAGAVDASTPATGGYTELSCITAFNFPSQMIGKVSTPCLTSARNDIEAGELEDPSDATFSIKQSDSTDIETLYTLKAAKTNKQWRQKNSADNSVTVFDGYLSDAKQQPPERNKAIIHDFTITVTRYWKFYETHPA